MRVTKHQTAELDCDNLTAGQQSQMGYKIDHDIAAPHIP